MRWSKVHRVGCILVAAAMWVLPVAESRGEVVTFTLDPAASHLDISGFLYGYELVSQDLPEDASMTTSYGGTVRVDVDDPFAPTQIEFLEAAAAAANSGNWLPEVGGGTVGEPGESDPGAAQPANYGIYVEIPAYGIAWGAFRDLAFTMYSELGEPENIVNGMFNSTQIFDAAAGILDAHVQSIAGDDASSDDVTGAGEGMVFNDASKGSYVVNGNLATLTLPVDITFPGNLETRYTGTLVATALLGGVLGDFNGNGILDTGDIDDLTAQSAGQLNPPEYDLNEDTLVNSQDVSIWIRDLYFSWIGDANLNGVFDSNDLIDVLAANTYELDVAAVWTTGDFNGDGRFSSNDLIDALADGGYELGERVPVAMSAVPEPSAFVCLALGLLLVFRRQRPC